MKDNMKIDDLSLDQMQIIENFCQKFNLQNLEKDEKIALNYFLNENISKFPASDILNNNYPFMQSTVGFASAFKQDLLALISLFSLKRDLENNKNQKKLIEQNDKIIELLTKISEK